MELKWHAYELNIFCSCLSGLKVSKYFKLVNLIWKKDVQGKFLRRKITNHGGKKCPLIFVISLCIFYSMSVNFYSESKVHPKWWTFIKHVNLSFSNVYFCMYINNSFFLFLFMKKKLNLKIVYQTLFFSQGAINRV